MDPFWTPKNFGTFWHFLTPSFWGPFFQKKIVWKTTVKPVIKKNKNCVKNHGKSSDKKKRYLFFYHWFYRGFHTIVFWKKGPQKEGVKKCQKVPKFFGVQNGSIYIYFNVAIMLPMCFQSKLRTRFYSSL